MPIFIRTRHLLGVECDHCARTFALEGRGEVEAYLTAKELHDRDLCTVCTDAAGSGWFAYLCQACTAAVSLPLAGPHECVNVQGYAFYDECMRGFYGAFDRGNRALAKAM